MIDIIESSDKKWFDFISEHPEATIFHHPHWSYVLSNTYGYKSFVAVLRGRKNEILVGLPIMQINSWITGKRWVALSFSDHCKPLFQNEGYVNQFIEELIRKANENNYRCVEIRSKLPALQIDINKNVHYLHLSKLDGDAERLFKRFRKKGVQYCIKRANKTGIEVKKKYDMKSLITFYDLHLKTRKKLGVPTQPKKYFLNLWEYLIKDRLGFLMLSYYNDIPIAGGVFLRYKNNIVYKYGATDPAYMNLYANHALLWEVIKYGCKNGFQYMDWGRTDKGHEGLRKNRINRVLCKRKIR
ncbi:MAG: lipid II:glycine glycyltransferase FemX [Candidatus Thorarchaeota archaeon]